MILLTLHVLPLTSHCSPLIACILVPLRVPQTSSNTTPDHHTLQHWIAFTCEKQLSSTAPLSNPYVIAPIHVLIVCPQSERRGLFFLIAYHNPLRFNALLIALGEVMIFEKLLKNPLRLSYTTLLLCLHHGNRREASYILHIEPCSHHMA
jgi:hypothetical protein